MIDPKTEAPAWALSDAAHPEREAEWRALVAELRAAREVIEASRAVIAVLDDPDTHPGRRSHRMLKPHSALRSALARMPGGE